MSDARDAVDAARIKIKKAAASMLVRKETLEAELERALADSSPRVPELEELLAVAESDYQGALKELRELGDLAKNLEAEEQRGIVRGAVITDPFVATDAADVALDNVRQYIGELEARVSLDKEMARDKKAEREQKVLDTKAELERLKAARGGAKPKTEGNGDESGDPPETPPKKRTL